MSKNPLALKIASIYARAFFVYSVETNCLHELASDFNNLLDFFRRTPEFVEYFSNPVFSKKEQTEVLVKSLKSEINKSTFDCLMLLVMRNRINLLPAVAANYLAIMFETARIKTIEIFTAFHLNRFQRGTLARKLRKITNAREIVLKISLDPSLIGGFLIKTKSKILDFTIKNQLKNLAKHLDSVLNI